MKLAVVTSSPTPYRDPVYDLIASRLQDDFRVFYCSGKEPVRDWQLDKRCHHHIFLQENYRAKKDGWNFIHNNPDVWRQLRAFKPDIVITTGFNPTHLYGWLYCLLSRKKHIAFVDTWAHSDSELTLVHRLVRKLVFKTSCAFLGPGERTAELYRSYGANPESIFQSHLCADTRIFNIYKPFAERTYHLMFSGQFHERKKPFFFVDVAEKVQQQLPDLKVLLIGNGPLKRQIIAALEKARINFDYPGFVQPAELPKYYADVKLFLFPTRLDAWGVVANEALASGTPVIVTPYAGAADDLVIDGRNGHIVELDSQRWADKIVELLSDEAKWSSLAENGLLSKEEFNYENAARGILAACAHAYPESPPNTATNTI